MLLCPTAGVLESIMVEKDMRWCKITSFPTLAFGVSSSSFHSGPDPVSIAYLQQDLSANNRARPTFPALWDHLFSPFSRISRVWSGFFRYCLFQDSLLSTSGLLGHALRPVCFKWQQVIGYSIFRTIYSPASNLLHLCDGQLWQILHCFRPRQVRTSSMQQTIMAP